MGTSHFRSTDPPSTAAPTASTSTATTTTPTMTGWYSNTPAGVAGGS